jgi:hypothetical protein
MANESSAPKKKLSKVKLILLSVLLVILSAGVIFYINFNKFLTSALNKAFEETLVADVYELKFENLRANPLAGSISIFDVTLRRREKPLKDYDYINSSLQLKTDKLTFENVDILLLLEANKLVVEKIGIIKPEIELDVNGYNPIFFPFREASDTSNKEKKLEINSYFLAEFELEEASFKVTNSVRNRDFTIENFNIILNDLFIDKNEQEDVFFLNKVEISLGKFEGNLKDNDLQYVSFSDFTINLDSIDVRKNIDTLIYRIQDFSSGVNSLDIQTKDSLFHITMKSFNLSYDDQSIKLDQLSFKPNVSNATIQKNYKFQHTQFSGTVGTVDFRGFNFDSLMYETKFFIEEIVLDSVNASIYKDNTKAKDLNHLPAYLGQTVMSIKNPVKVNSIKANQVNITNEERKPDGDIAKVTVSQGTVEVRNITNLAPNEELSLKAVALLAGKVKFDLKLDFSYSKPQFAFEGRLENFKLTGLNQVIQAYTPAKFLEGTADEIKFSGIALNSSSSGTLSFLYHDLKVDLQLEEKAKWKSDIVSFAANTALHTNNPVSPNSPPRQVKFQADRDMNKGFVNLIIKSILNGMKETIILSKENRKEFKEAKKEAKKDAKKDKN